MIKTCPICGKNYRTYRKKQVFCSESCKTQNIKTCDHCGKEYVSQFYKTKKKNYCSKECSYKSRLKNTYHEHECIMCGKKYKSKAHNSVYCSNRCKLDSIKIPIRTELCEWCGEEFKTQTTEKCCSKECKRLRKQNLRKVRRRENIELRIKDYLRHYLYRAVKGKQYNSKYYFDYTVPELIIHLNSLLTRGMTWDNYGRWHIDHIKPLCKFEFINLDGSENIVEIKKAMSLSNLQPLWAIDNIKKSGKYPAAI